MHIKEALDFSIFPSMLLITTLFRLGLNVSSTRLILTKEGQAGKIIETFGSFVLQGNIVVGTIIFIIIVLVQFIVIAKGAERVAEVAARFTLDAMPGKQMAIDADLSSGLITEDEARLRKHKVQKESDFYGAMDGATKIVKGDVIMSIIITLIKRSFRRSPDRAQDRAGLQTRPAWRFYSGFPCVRFARTPVGARFQPDPGNGRVADRKSVV